MRKNDFTVVEGDFCLEADKPIVRFYTSSTCASCKGAQSVFEKVVSEMNLAVYEWELDTGDNLFTVGKEKALPKQEFDALKQFNSKGEVPAIVIACKWVRIGNAYAEFEEAREEKVLRDILSTIS